MPRRTRNSRKKEACPPGAASKKKLAAIAEETEGESLDSLLDDFDIQTVSLKKQALKQFEKEAKMMLTALPQKASIPKEVLKMEVSEFIRRGGSFQSVWESLINERLQPSAQLLPDSVEETAKPPPSDGEGKTEQQGGVAVASDEQPETYITPAMSTRSRRAVSKRLQTTSKRKPKPLEEVKVQAYSNVSGSPVDERTLLQLHKDEFLGDIQDQLMEATAKFPQKWRTKLIQSFRQIKAHSTVQDDVLVTPAIRR